MKHPRRSGNASSCWRGSVLEFLAMTVEDTDSVLAFGVGMENRCTEFSAPNSLRVAVNIPCGNGHWPRDDIFPDDDEVSDEIVVNLHASRGDNQQLDAVHLIEPVGVQHGFAIRNLLGIEDFVAVFFQPLSHALVVSPSEQQFACCMVGVDAFGMLGHFTPDKFDICLNERLCRIDENVFLVDNEPVIEQSEGVDDAKALYILDPRDDFSRQHIRRLIHEGLVYQIFCHDSLS
jgi:hypothetical protein